MLVQPNLVERIITAQSKDAWCQEKLKEINSGETTNVAVGSDGGLRFMGRLCVPEDKELQRIILDEAHRSRYTIYPGNSKMYRDLKRHFWWSGMKLAIATYVSKCLTCQQVKIEHQRPGGMLQPLPIPTWKWDEISMDFIVGLPRSKTGHDSIWVIVDRLTKYAHFIPVKTTYTTDKLAHLYIENIVALHGVPSSIVSYRDSHFTSKFWNSFQKALGSELRLSTAFHPQTDGQTERVNQVLEDMLRERVLDFKGSWEDNLKLIEFSYNKNYHSSIGMEPFEALYGRPGHSPVCWAEVGDNSLYEPEIVQETTEKVTLIRERLQTTQSRQKSYADQKRRHVEFNIGDHVLLKVSPMKGVMRFGKKGKLAPRYVGPFPVIERIGKVAYRLALPEHLSSVHNVFHVSMLRKHLRDEERTHVIDFKDLEVQHDGTLTEKPYRIIDRKVHQLRSKAIPLVKVQWNHHNENEATWEREGDVRAKYPFLFDLEVR